MLGLFRRGLAAECAARPVYSGQVAPGVLSEALQTRADEWRELSPQLRKMLKKTRAIDARHRATAKEYGPKHEKMIAVEREKRAQVAELKRMVPALEKQVAASVRAYVKAAQEGERPTNERMTAFRKAVLSPLFAWRAALECADADWKQPALVGAVWERFCKIETGRDFLGELRGHTKLVTCVAYSPDGKRIVTGSDDKTLRVWDALTGREIMTLKGHTFAMGCVAYSPDGKRIVSGSYRIGSNEKTLRVWDAQTGREILALKGHPVKGDVMESVKCVAYSPDSKYIVSGGRDKTLRLWDAQTGREVLALEGHTDQVTCVAYSPNGKRIVSGSYNIAGSNDKTVRVWDARTGREVLALKGHTDGVKCVAYSPDSKHIVSGSRDETLRVWDAQTGRGILAFKGHPGGVDCVAYSPDGKRIVSGSTPKVPLLTRRFECGTPRRGAGSSSPSRAIR